MFFFNLTNCRNWSAVTKSIACISSYAATDRRMAYHFALGVWSANSKAWINTFLIDTRSICDAVRV